MIASLAGIIDAAILTAQHYRIAKEGLMQKSFCTLSALIDCDTALLSEKAYLVSLPDFRLPNTEAGLLFCVIVLVLSLWAWAAPERRRSLFQFILLLSSLAAVFCLYMAYVLFFELKVICIFCVLSYVIVIVILLASWMVLLGPLRPFLSLGRFLQYALLSLVIFGLGVAFFFGLNKRAHSGEPQFNEAELTTIFLRQEPVDILVDNRPTWGDPKAPITIVDFSDFQCPFCRRAAFSLKPSLGPYRAHVKIVYMNYPLDNSCNPNIEHKMHPAACLAAKAALCAFKKDSALFWSAHDFIFENQKKISRNLLTKELAPHIGFTEEEMNACLISPEIEELLAEDVARGDTAGVRGTPSVYINGRYLRGWMEPKILQAILKAELARARGP